MFHDFVELVTGIAWPLIVLFIVLKFSPEVRALLKEIPRFSRRVRSADVLGAKIELEMLERDVPLAQTEVSGMVLPAAEFPPSDKTKADR